ncbi:FAD-binding oxidoreductase [Dactylosporangium darangshiense]|uniref:FAD-binding oxidoreductase n=1 Tax=Dactylosporangium darangshiense TaxID=579108 RepID=A0ABP8CZW2_9ACTN
MNGRLYVRGEDGYEAARVGRVFNARRPDRYPAAVLLAADAGDVAAGVRLAAERGWTVAVRSGGHSWAAWSLHDDALLIDLGRLDGLGYDPDTRVATAGPAVPGGLRLAPFLAGLGRAFPGGHCPRVGLGGYLLQGGQGWNGRSVGWACESVAAVDVVTAGGEHVRADAEHNADLYWAARGAGPGFPAVVTRFHLDTQPAAGRMWHDTWTFAPGDAAAVLAWLHELLPGLDRRVEPVLAATRLPAVPLDEGKDHPGTALLLHTTVMAVADDEAARLLGPFDAGPPGARALGHARGRTTIEAENRAQAEQNPDGHRYAVDCTWSDAPAAVLAPELSRLWSELDTPHSFSIWYGWAPHRPLPDMALTVEANVYLATYAIYTDPADDERYRTWVHERTAALARHGAGVYLGDTDFTRRQDRFLSDAAYARLQRVRDHWDPDGRIASYLCHDPKALNAHG